jgi:hypothetical protein
MGEERKRGSSRVALFVSVLAIAGVVSFSLDRALANQNAMTGEGLLDVCTRAEADWIGFCNGYIQAAIDLMGRQEGSACIPEGTTRNEIYDVVIPLLTSSTRMQNENAFLAITAAISMKFKCE